MNFFFSFLSLIFFFFLIGHFGNEKLVSKTNGGLLEKLQQKTRDFRIINTVKEKILIFF